MQLILIQETQKLKYVSLRAMQHAICQVLIYLLIIHSAYKILNFEDGCKMLYLPLLKPEEAKPDMSQVSTFRQLLIL